MAIVLFVLVACSILGAVTGSISGETDAQIALNHTGEADKILPGDRKHNISDIMVENAYDTAETHDEISLFIDFSDLEHNGEKYSDVEIGSIQLSNGNLKQVSHDNSTNNTVLQLKIEQHSSDKNTQFQHIEFKDLNTTFLEAPSRASYNLAVANSSSDITYDDLRSEDRVVNSNEFKVIGGTLVVPDQATGSSRLSSDEPTEPSIGVKNLTSNVNSTIVATQDTDDEIVIGYKSYASNPTQISSMYNHFVGGEMKAYLVPNKHLDKSNISIGEPAPKSVSNSSIAMDHAHIFWSDIKFENNTYNSTTPNISVKSATLQDLEDENTKFAVSLHPLAASGDMILNTTLAHSDILSGDNDNIPLHLSEQSDEQTTFSHSNRFAVAVRLVDEEADSDLSPLEASSILPNSDLHTPFVRNGVSDKGYVTIDPNFDSTISNTSEFTYDSSTVGPQFYAGEFITYNLSNVSSNNVEIHQIKEDREVVTAVGNPIEGTDHVLFNTTKIAGANYTFSDGSSRISPEFRLVGENDQEVDLDIKNSIQEFGSLSNILLYHNTREMDLLLTNTDDQSTAAIVELTTPTDDAIPVTFNTYAAGDPSLADDLVTVGANATVESVETSTPNGTLSPGTYTLSVRSEYGSVTTSANETIDIRARATRDLATYTTSALDPDELRSAADVEAAIANETLSSSTTVTDTETVVYAVDASGVAGAPAVRDAELDTSADVEAFDGFSFGVRPTTTESDLDTDSATETLSSSDDDPIGVIPADATPHVDDEGFYLVAAGDTALATDDPPADGDEFTATFRVDDERLKDSAQTDDEHAVTTTVTYDAPDRDASGDPTDPTDDTEESSDPDRDGADGTGSGSGAGPGGPGGSGGPGGGPTGGAPERGDSPGTVETPTDHGDEAAGWPSVDTIQTDRMNSRPLGEVSGVVHLRFAYRHWPDAMPNATGTDRRSEANSDGDSASDVGTSPGARSSTAAESGESADRSDSERAPATPDSPGYDNAPIRSTAYDLPGFGPVGTLVALVSASLLALRRP